MENQEVVKEAVTKAQTEERKEIQEEKKAVVEKQHDRVSKNLENIYAERLKNKAAELEAIERTIDEKIANFKDFVQETAMSGRGLAAVKKTEQQVKEENIDASVKKLMSVMK